MIRNAKLLKLRDHLTAGLSTMITAHILGLIDAAARLPRGVLTLDGLSGQLIGAALCGLVYAIVLTVLVRRRLITGPLYRCGETRPVSDYAGRYAPGSVPLLEGWQYR